MAAPSLSEKLAAWLLLGLFSVALAEVPSGSFPFVFASWWGLLVTLPLYLLHAVLLAGVVFRFSGNLRYWSLALAGGLFGLYEAYVTKVLWTPTWEPIPVRLGGVHVFETVLLVLFWHPLMAFVVPLALVEVLCTRSRLVVDGLPRRIRSFLAIAPRRAAAVGALGLAAVQGALVASPVTALAFTGLTAAVLLGAVAAWRRWVGADRYRLEDLLPDGRELRTLVVLLLALYVVLGLAIRPEVLPGLASQATVWLLYAAFALALVVELRRERRRPSSSPEGSALPLRTVLPLVGLYFPAVGVASLVLPQVAVGVFVGMYLAAFVVGGALVIHVAREVWQSRPG